MGELTQYDYLKGSLTKHFENVDILTQNIKKYCQNTEFPLDERWDLFIESGLGYHQGRYLTLQSFDLDRIYFEKYLTYDMDWLVDIIYDYISDDISLLEGEEGYEYIPKSEFDEGGPNIDKLIDNKLNEIKEEILQLFIKSFEYSW